MKRMDNSVLNTSSDSDVNVKKARLDDSQSQSCVLHVRGLPIDITDFDVAMLAIPFGTLSNMILTRKNGQALIEMDTIESTIAMHDYYSALPGLTIRGKGSIEFQYSKYSTLTKPNSNQQSVNAIAEANKEFVNFSNDSDGAPRNVLHIQVENAVPSIELGYLPFYKAFRKFGVILRAISFKKSDSRHAFLEFESSTSAHVANLLMNNVPLFGHEFGPNACILHTEFSRQPTLEVHREDSFSRDFLRNPWDESQEGNTYPSGNGYKYSPAKFDLDLLSEERLFSLDPGCLSAIANRLIKPMLRAASSIAGPQADMLRAQATTLGGLSALITDHNQPTYDNYNWSGPPMMNHDDMSPNMRQNKSPVVFASNLNVERVNPDTLFILFGIYGDVQRVKIIHNKRDAALIQFTDSNQANRAVGYLNGIPLYGKTLRCVISKNLTVTLPAQGSDDTDTKNTCDYSGHRLHRFKRTNSRNHYNICAPSTILHVSNIPEDYKEEDVASAFEQVIKSPVKQVKVFRGDKRMALIQFEDMGQAVAALIAMHDYPIEDNVHIRVTFSKSIM